MSDRKYKQRGYMDDEGGEPTRRSSGGRDRSEKPRGRGLGKPTKTVFRCSRCGSREAVAQLLPETTCSQCSADLHTCTNCSYFDTAASNECREPIPARISKKSEKNECPSFSAKTVQEFESESVTPEDARSAFDSLFDF